MVNKKVALVTVVLVLVRMGGATRPNTEYEGNLRVVDVLLQGDEALDHEGNDRAAAQPRLYQYAVFGSHHKAGSVLMQGLASTISDAFSAFSSKQTLSPQATAQARTQEQMQPNAVPLQPAPPRAPTPPQPGAQLKPYHLITHVSSYFCINHIFLHQYLAWQLALMGHVSCMQDTESTLEFCFTCRVIWCVLCLHC